LIVRLSSQIRILTLRPSSSPRRRKYPDTCKSLTVDDLELLDGQGPGPGSWFQVPGSRFLVPGSWVLGLGPGAGILDPGSWGLGPGA
jgi:hypothetical protein